MWKADFYAWSKKLGRLEVLRLRTKEWEDYLQGETRGELLTKIMEAYINPENTTETRMFDRVVLKNEDGSKSETKTREDFEKLRSFL